MSINQHITDFLDYYCQLEKPEYAVLLKGSWGTGKTWFIKQYKENPRNEQKFLYVSLYGLASFSEIEDAFFQQIHPLLASKGMEIAGKILKGALKTTIKIDLDGNKGEDASITASVPNIPDYLNIKDRILIFDDIERCDIRIESILGYINHFVEHQGIKAIIIANEDEIIKKDKGNEEQETGYKRIKEKLIGKTFEITPDVETALNEFIKQLHENKQLKSFLESNTSSIIEIYNKANYKNLRHLKQALFDFERFFNGLPDDAKEKNDLLLQLLRILLIFSIEIKAGKVQVQDITNYTIWSEEEKHKQLRKYNPSYLTSPINNDCWMDFLDNGIMNKEIIKESIHNSRYYDNRPDWVKLWGFRDLTDDEFETLLKNVETEYQKKQYTDIGIILHITFLFLELFDKKLYNKEKKEILEYGKDYIDYLKQKNKSIDFEFSPFGDSYAGLGFHALSLAESNNLIIYLKQKIEEVKTESLPQEAKDLLNLIKTNTEQFTQMIILLPGTSEKSYSQIPILNYIKSEDFVTTYLSLEPEQQLNIMRSIGSRYRYDKQDLMPELEWLKKVKELLSNYINNKPSGYRVQLFIKILNTTIKELEAA